MIASIIIVFLTGSLFYLCAVAIAETTSIYVTIDPTPTKIGDTFTASLRVADIEGLWGWNAKISWNPEVLTATRSNRGSFLISGGASDMRPPPPIDNVYGAITISQTLLEFSDVSGSGVLELISFEVIGTGNADVIISDVILWDKYLVDETRPVTSAHFAIPFTVGQIPVITISSEPTPADAVIDVSTDKTTYLSGDSVSVSARVTRNGGGVANVHVALTVFPPNGDMEITYVETTDGSGRVFFTFTLPAIEPAPAIIFDEWSILAAASVSDVTITKTVTFNVQGSTTPIEVEYLLSIKSISVNSSIPKLGKVSLNITLEGTIPEGLLLTANIFDSAQVPIGMSTISLKSQTEGTTTNSTEILIPSWAFTGQATAYINILTATPEKGGVLYCPQATTTFQIT